MRKIWVIIFVVIIIAVVYIFIHPERVVLYDDGLHNELAPTPPRGWNSWNSFGCEVTEEEVKKVADYMADSLLDYGWEYLVIDLGWQYPPELKTQYILRAKPQHHIDEYGRFMPDTVKFPSAAGGRGVKPLADYLHSRGLKLGIHILRGIPWDAVAKKMKIKGGRRTADEIADSAKACDWSNSMLGLDFEYPEAQLYYNSIFELYAKWQVDFVKVDDVAKNFHENDIIAVHKAMKNCGRDMVLSLSPGPTEVKHADFFAQHADLWRISDNVWDHWKFVLAQVENCRKWYPYIKAGNWLDCDILPLGKLRKTGANGWVAGLIEDKFENIGNEYTRFTKSEQITVMSLWSIFRSPLMMGGYIPENDQFTNNLLTNKEVLKINSHSKNLRELKYDDKYSVWLSESLDGYEKYLLFINFKDHLSQDFAIDWKAMDIKGNYKVWDVWHKEVVCKSDSGFAASIPPHGSGFYKITPD